MEERTLSLMHSCRNWGTEKCHSEVRKWKCLERMRDNEGIKLHPVKEDVDEICRNCPALKIK